MTLAQLEEHADGLARKHLDLPDRHAVFALLDADELRGTIAEAEFKMLRDMFDRARSARP